MPLILMKLIIDWNLHHSGSKLEILSRKCYDCDWHPVGQRYLRLTGCRVVTNVMQSLRYVAKPEHDRYYSVSVTRLDNTLSLSSL